MNKVKQKNRGRRRQSNGGVDLQAIGERMKQLRGRKTQQEFARALGISQAQLSKYESGQTAPPLRVLIALSGRCGKTIGWILTGES